MAKNGKNHKFSKGIVILCVIMATLFCISSFVILSLTGADSTGILTASLAFFGGELLFLCLKRVFEK